MNTQANSLTIVQEFAIHISLISKFSFHFPKFSNSNNGIQNQRWWRCFSKA